MNEQVNNNKNKEKGVHPSQSMSYHLLTPEFLCTFLFFVYLITCETPTPGRNDGSSQCKVHVWYAKGGEKEQMQNM
jgi:hypothetical protein